jgi:hypothetical protein
MLYWLKLSEFSEYRLKSELLVCVDCAVDGRLSHSGLDSRLLYAWSSDQSGNRFGDSEGTA